MQRTVCSLNSSRMVSWIILSVPKSTAEVASSRRRILFERRSARARHICCRWPTEKLFPPSVTIMSRDGKPCSVVSRGCWLASPAALWFSSTPSRNTWSARWDLLRACQRAGRSLVFSGSRLKRRVPEKRTGSWGMIEILCRRRCSPTVQMSRPSMNVPPPSGSTSRSSTFSTELLPAPVRPQMPNFSRGFTLKDNPFSTKGSSGLYRRRTSRNSIAPWLGQLVRVESISK
mmetsp:Transcript_33147/g.72258  ORF Transcript_33147/g.72258 Transcript_33147/m.72258 type:complete len:231 (-) Transcript_33147:3301-3993(-)